MYDKTMVIHVVFMSINTETSSALAISKIKTESYTVLDLTNSILYS